MAVISLASAASSTPMDVGKEQIARYQSAIDNLLGSYAIGPQRYSLNDLVTSIEPDAGPMGGDIGRNCYMAIRDGMGIFKTISTLLAERTGLRTKIANTDPTQTAIDSEIKKLREFCFGFASYAASLYIARKLHADYPEEHEKSDVAALKLDLNTSESMAMAYLLAPVYQPLIQQKANKDVFGDPKEFPHLVTDVFDQYARLALQQKDKHADLLPHIDGYTWRIMDSFLELKGYENKTLPTITVGETPAFQPIETREIVGNGNAKREINRAVERMVLYDPQEQMNPVLELGGLFWTTLFDGPPGTGKSSLQKLAMTRLSELAPLVGMKYNIVAVDQSIKDEFYGKTGKLLLGKLSATSAQNILTLCMFDDIDLLTSSRDDAQGADNDINNIIMQYLDGVFTRRLGNVINYAASNKPDGLDDALRNRFNYRLLIDGPVTNEDFADMLNLTGGKMIKNGLLAMEAGYTPFATQDEFGEHGWTQAAGVSAYMAEQFADRKNATMLEFGTFMADLKKKNPLITGRSMNAIMEAVKNRCADFDIPEEWFADRSRFLDQPFARKKEMLKDLYVKITPDVLFQEAQRYFDSEERYANNEQQKRIGSGYDNMMFDMEAQIQFYEEQIRQGDTSMVVRLGALEARVREMRVKGAESMNQTLTRIKERGGA